MLKKLIENNMDKVFASGIFYKERELKNKNGEPFTVKSISVKSEEFVGFLSEHTKEDGYCNMDIKFSEAKGKHYIELNTWEPK